MLVSSVCTVSYAVFDLFESRHLFGSVSRSDKLNSKMKVFRPISGKNSECRGSTQREKSDLFEPAPPEILWVVITFKKIPYIV